MGAQGRRSVCFLIQVHDNKNQTTTTAYGKRSSVAAIHLPNLPLVGLQPLSSTRGSVRLSTCPAWCPVSLSPTTWAVHTPLSPGAREWFRDGHRANTDSFWGRYVDVRRRCLLLWLLSWTNVTLGRGQPLCCCVVRASLKKETGPQPEASLRDGDR